MKKLLFFLLTLLTLSSCVADKDDYHYLTSGKIEEIQSEKTVVINKMTYSIPNGIKDYFLNDNLKVGDEVNVYVNEKSVILSKLDFVQTVSVARDLNPYFASDGNGGKQFMAYVVLISIYLVFCFHILFFIVAKLEMQFSFSESWGDNVWLRISLGIPFVVSLCLLLMIPNFRYQGSVSVENVSQYHVVTKNTVYPKEKVYNFSKIQEGKNYFMYQADDKIYLLSHNSLNANHPELLVPAVNHAATKTAKIICGVFSFLFVLSFGTLWRVILAKNSNIISYRDVLKRLSFCKKYRFEEEVDASGGHGSFVKK